MYMYKCICARLCCQLEIVFVKFCGLICFGKTAEKLQSCNRPHVIHVHACQYPNIALSLSGQNCEFLRFPSSLIPKRDLGTKKTLPNTEVCPESLGAMLKY